MEPDDWEHLTESDQASIRDLLGRYIQKFAPLPKTPLYHYTRGGNLIEIIKNHSLWATHIACLNDTKEWLYAVEELDKRVIDRLATATDEVKPLLTRMHEYLSSTRLEVSPAFVAC